ncbi:hypothetical protein TTHERM_00446550 (macronuclear) [Tetrahymena thermophila SB210]|uniref:Uncharacterized protein n=1 Tax=Tetrahymena thermophila (strain SB210) TaxID=312017 RepID=I7MLW1_TETTS|nr:hypothetical protein TTHERM_00446550 [Tetrahymena thermophila SB210]EAS03173.2 hypothetical protein TTHERM_00446550 [Tetrahymena thermophila SB210]|eukprot:XP_001023418.2 hypothetical protein TTHERM_00446550 [Tetrahymena thermophila SB210]
MIYNENSAFFISQNNDFLQINQHQNEDDSRIIQESKQNDFYGYQKQINDESQNVLNQIKVCQAQNISLLFKSPAEQNSIILYGDLLIEARKDFDNIDYTLQICNIYLQKKRVVQINYDKKANIIEMISENLTSGSRNFQYAQQILLKTQNKTNYMLAQHLQMHEQKVIQQINKYQAFLADNDEDILYQAQAEFFQNMKQQLTQNICKNEFDFFCYTSFSYIDKQDLGFPIQKCQGINEAACALFGMDASQSIELLQRYGFIEVIIKRGFPKDMQEQEPFGHIFMMQNQESFIQIKQLFNSDSYAKTIDGITIRLRMELNQATQVYNGYIISSFYYSQFIIKDQEIERVLQIRSSGSHINSSDNILDLLLRENIYSTFAKKFGNFISNPQNFKQPCQQDLFPEKTCKYNLIQKPVQ